MYMYTILCTCSAASSPPLRLVCPLSLILSIALLANTLPGPFIEVRCNTLLTYIYIIDSN